MGSRGCVYCWCGCREQGTGRRLGARCPRRGDARHGSWYLSLELPAGAEGQRCRIRRGGFPDRHSADQALARLRVPSLAESGTGPVTVGPWLEGWLAARTAPRPARR